GGGGGDAGGAAPDGRGHADHRGARLLLCAAGGLAAGGDGRVDARGRAVRSAGARDGRRAAPDGGGGGRARGLLSPRRRGVRAEGGPGAVVSVQCGGGACVLPRHGGRQRRAIGGRAAVAADAGGAHRANGGDRHRVDEGGRCPPSAARGGDRGGPQGRTRSLARAARRGVVARKPDPDLGTVVRHPDPRAAG